MATVTIKTTPLLFKNGKTVILEENEYEFCPEIWDYIKSYMGFVSEEQFKYDKWFKSAVIHQELHWFKDGCYAEQTIKKFQKQQWDFGVVDLRKKNLCKKTFNRFFERVKRQFKEKDYSRIRQYAVYNYVGPYYNNERERRYSENKIEENIQLYIDLLNVKF
jgi:arsenate reductase-like glutaredoxin family protein